MSNQGQTKRLIVCCDGTWSDSDNVALPSSLVLYYPEARLRAPTNVTRISRALKQTGLDGKQQIIYYDSCVGTGSNIIDVVAGGMFGVGIIDPIRAAYSFISANYAPGDEIILIGFSRGAFTARSVAGMIHSVGILTRQGMADFNTIFKDQKNFLNRSYYDPCPNHPFPNKPKGINAAPLYKQRLEMGNLTRVSDIDGRRIHVQAVAVWDTAGALGVPHFMAFAKLGLDAVKDYRFRNTDLDINTKHAFQALALDERRAPFAPAIWERKNDPALIDLRQVWFPGTHKNVGGVCDDKELANITLAWMMDQLASIGVGFLDGCIDQIFQDNVLFYHNLPKRTHLMKKQWAKKSTYEQNKPVRPFGLGKICETYKGMHHFAGKAVRTPGLYHRASLVNSAPTIFKLVQTNERIHSSVRIRMQLSGLGPNDHGLYKCPALTKPRVWHLRQMESYNDNPIPSNASWGPEGVPGISDNYLRWVWFYTGPEKTAPQARVLIEDNLGPYQRQLLMLSKQQEGLLS